MEIQFEEDFDIEAEEIETLKGRVKVTLLKSHEMKDGIDW